MITVPQAVDSIIKSSPILSQALEEDFANYSSIARRLQPIIEQKLFKKVTVGSIVMALKRLKVLPQENNRLSKILGEITDLSVRSNLAALTFSNSSSLFENQSRLLNTVSKTPNSFLTISNGVYETSVFISRNLLEDAQNIFASEDLKLKEEDLSSITLILPEDAINTPGIHYSVFKKLFSNGVNIFETATSFTELTIFLRSEDTERAFGILKKLN